MVVGPPFGTPTNTIRLGIVLVWRVTSSENVKDGWDDEGVTVL